MAYLISDKRHGNEVYVTKEALNCGFFFFFPLLETGMTDLLSSLLTSAAFVIWCVLFAYHWHLFPVLCLELSSEKKKKIEKGLRQRLGKRSGGPLLLLRESLVSLLERLVPHGLVASPCVTMSSSGDLENSREQIHFTSGL